MGVRLASPKNARRRLPVRNRQASSRVVPGGALYLAAAFARGATDPGHPARCPGSTFSPAGASHRTAASGRGTSHAAALAALGRVHRSVTQELAQSTGTSHPQPSRSSRRPAA